jgi:hypothetical protein
MQVDDIVSRYVATIEHVVAAVDRALDSDAPGRL